MARDSGTPVSVSGWIANVRCGPDSRFVLFAVQLDGTRQLVHEWEPAEVTTDVKRWSEFACGVATDDAHARGAATRYELTHFRGDTPKATCRLFRNARRDDDEDAPALDGSHASIITQLQRHNERTAQMMVDMARAQTIATTSQNQALAAAFAMMQSMARELHELRASGGVPTKRTFDGPVGEVLELAMPDVVAQILDRFLPNGVEPKATTGSAMDTRKPPKPRGSSAPAD